MQRDWTLAENKPLVEADIVVLRAQSATTNQLTASLALKADQSAVTSSLALKADQSAVTSSLALKADQSAVTSSLALKADQSAVTSSLALKADASTVTALSASNALKAPLLNPTFQGVVSLPAGSTLNGVPLTSGGGGGGGTPSIVVNSVAFPSGDVQLRFNFSAGLPTTEWTWQLNIVDELDRTPSAVRFVCVAKTATSLTVKGIPAYSFADGITERSCYFFLQVWQASSPFDQLVRFAGMAWRSEGGSANLEPYSSGGV
jgi:hypothetical protein